MKKVWKIALIFVLLAIVGVVILIAIPWGEYESQVEKTKLTSTVDTSAVDENTPPSIDDLSGLYTGGSENGKSEIIFDVDGLKKTKGTFNTFTVSFDIKDNFSESTIEVVIDAASINTENDMRDEHLQEEGFFEVLSFPKIVYTATSISYEKGHYEAKGELGLVGKTTPLSFSFKHLGGGDYKETGETFEAFEGEFTFDRVKYGMEEDGSVGNEVSITFYTELVKAS